jgi:hypothetical protein
VSNRKPDSYSYHDVTQCDEQGRVVAIRWTVIAEWLDEDGDIEEVENVADYASETAAAKKVDALTRALEAP